MAAPCLDARFLSRLLLLQSMIGQFDDPDATIAFACRGLEELPGAARVRHVANLGDATNPTSISRPFPLTLSGRTYGHILVECSNQDAFEPYNAYVANLCFMLTVVLDGQRLRRIELLRREELEVRVMERTRELMRLVQELEIARRRVEEQRAKAERYLEMSEALILELDCSGCVAVINQRGAEILGYSAHALHGKNWFDIAVPEEKRHEGIEEFRQVMAGVRSLSKRTEDELLRADGTRRRVTWHNSLRLGGSGEPIGVLCSGIDVTERTRLMEAAQQAEKMKSLAVLAGGIAHDFNNLLTALFGHLELARDAEDAGELSRAHIVDAEQAFARTQSLTRQLLTFAKGGHPIRKVEPLPPLIRSTVEFALSGSSIRRVYDLPPDLHNCSVDSNQLSQVFENLAINALQAMPQGGVLRIEAQNVEVNGTEVPDLEMGSYVAVAFRDDGPGIPSHIMPRIFDPFFTTKPQGTGLGLASAYSIARRHGGHLQARSPGKGAEFRIYLPAVAGTRVCTASVSGEARREHGSGRVLVMDDEPMLRELMTRQLKRLGYEVVAASDGQEAVDLVRRDPQLQLAILDLTVPGGVGGAEAAKTLRALRPSMLLVASSGYSEDPILASPNDHGFDESLRKPFRLDHLGTILRTLLSPS